MNNSQNKTKLNMKVKLSTIWIVVMLNMIFADILSFMIALETGEKVGLANIEMIMLVAAVVTQIPIWMIFLSRFLKYKINRIANIVAGILTIVYVVGGGSLEPHYIFIASVEVACMLYIIWNAWKWRKSYESHQV